MKRLLFLLLITYCLPFIGEASESLLEKDNAQAAFEQQFLKFTSNGGQWDERVIYRSTSPGWGANVNFLKNGLSFGHKKHVIEGEDTTLNLLVWNILFKNSNPDIKISERNTSEKNINYFIGGKKAHAYTASTISYNNVYRNIDARYYYSQNYLKYDYVVRPGGNVNSIQMTCEGIQDLKLNDKGDLEISTSFGTCVEQKPYTYQLIDGKITEVKSRFVIYDDNTFGFSVDSAYNKKLDLIIDPVQLKWGTYIGGNHGGVSTGAGHFLYDVDIDASGNIYVCGAYDDTNFPVTPGVYNMSNSGGQDMVVYKVSPDASTMIFCTYIGGDKSEEAFSLEVDALSNVYVLGRTVSANLYTSPGCFQSVYGGRSNVVFCKLDPDAANILYQTYIGGATGFGLEWGVFPEDLAIDNFGNGYITGFAFQTDYPTTPNCFDAISNATLGFPPKYDAFFSKIATAGNGAADLLYSTYLGNTERDAGYNIKVNALGYAVISGTTESTNFPTFPLGGCYDDSHNGFIDLFVSIIAPNGNNAADLIYSTFVGGSDAELVGGQGSNHSMAINALGEVFVTGETQSNDFPTTPLAFDNSKLAGASSAAYAFRLNPASTGINDMVYSTYIGGNTNTAGEIGFSLSLLPNNEVFVVGATSHPYQTANFFVTPCASLNLASGYSTPPCLPPLASSPGSLFVLRLSANGQKAIYSGVHRLGGFTNYDPIPSAIHPVSCGNNTTYEIIIGGNFQFGTCSSAGGSHPVGVFGFPLATTAGTIQPLLYDTLMASPLYYPSRSGTLQKLAQKIEPDFTADTVCVGFPTTFVNTTNECGLWDSVKTWYWDFGDGTTSTDKTPVHTFPNPGIYNVKLKASCPYDSITKQVEVLTGGAFAGPDTSICVGQSITITAAPGADTYTWIPADGLSCTTCQIVTANPTVTTTYTLTTTSLMGFACAGIDTIKISVDPAPVISVSDPANICTGKFVTLTATGGNNYLWSTGETTSSVSVGPASNTTYSVIAYNNPACKDTGYIDVTVDPGVNASVMPGSADICEGESVNMTATGSGAISYSWSTGEISDAITVFPISTITYSVIVSNTDCEDTVYVPVTVSSYPLADAGPDTAICAGNSITLTGSGGMSYLWSEGSSTSTTDVTPLLSTVYTLTVSNNNCKDYDTVEVTVNPLPVVTVGDNITILEGESITLSVIATGSIQWSPPTGLSCTDCTDPVATPKVTTTYYITTTDAKGCSSTDTITVFVEITCRDFYIPNAFSPNEDSQNDIFYVKGNCLKEFKFTIFDRWGTKVFDTDNIEEGWDGKYKGKELDSGVFFYTLFAVTTTGKEIILTGNIHLVR